jgi:CHAT domain-containing protein
MDAQAEAICLELGQLPDRTSRERFLERYPELASRQTVQQLAESVRSAVRVDVHRALGLAEAASAIGRALGTGDALALGLRAKANALWLMGDCRQATRLYYHAASLFTRAGDRTEVARTLSSSIQSLALLGEYERAFEAARRAREIFTELGESLRVARLEINTANIFHRQNRYAEALTAYKRAYEQLLPHRDAEGIGVALHNMAVCLIALDDFKGALETYGRVREFCQREEMPLLVAQADYNVAFVYYLRGDYTKALELLRSTRETYRKNGDTYHLSLCDLDQSEIYLELSLVEEAAEMAQNSLDHFEELGMKFESARALTNLAIAVSLRGDAERALQLFGRAKMIAVGENNPVWPNLIDLYRALVLLEENAFEEADVLSRSARDFFASAGMPSKHVLCLLLLTRLCLKRGDIGPAAQHCDEALRVLEQLDAPILIYQAYFSRGQIYEASGDTDRAYSCYRDSQLALETLRSSLQRQELKIGFMQNRLEVYSRLAQLCLDRGTDEASLEEALSYIEAAKSRTLRDLILQGAQPSRAASAESELDTRLRDLRKELNWYYHRMEREQLSQEGARSENLDALKHEAKQREQALLRLLREMPETANVGAALRNSSTATLAQIRAALADNAALLEYFAIGEQVYVAAVTSQKLKIVPVTSKAEMVHRLRMLQFQISKFRLGSEYTERFHQVLLQATDGHLRAMYEQLIAPIEGELEVRDLVIVPFGPLHSLPFHALYDGQRYLIDRFNICYQPSASLFANSYRDGEAREGSSLILGIDDPALAHIREEAEAVAAAVAEPLLILGPEATEGALRNFGYTSRLIHIASHGIFRQDSPMFSSIKLADSYLTLYDLYHMNLPVDLLTLSGCVTGLNVVVEGDELLGLTRGLLYAGARSLLLTLWEVDDRSTAEFMREFYSRLRAEPPRKADAVRSAMLELRKQYPHPYYWAPFKLIGRALGG